MDYCCNIDSSNNPLYFLDNPQPIDFVHHPAVGTLSRVIDMQNTCGYITLLNPHLTSRTDTDMDDNASMFQFTADPHSGDLMKLDGVFTEGGYVAETESEECNGIQSKNEDGVKNFEDWCLLDMHFGLPLFDAKLNQEISSKVCFFSVCLPFSIEFSTSAHATSNFGHFVTHCRRVFREIKLL